MVVGHHVGAGNKPSLNLFPVWVESGGQDSRFGVWKDGSAVRSTAKPVLPSGQHTLHSPRWPSAVAGCCPHLGPQSCLVDKGTSCANPNSVHRCGSKTWGRKRRLWGTSNSSHLVTRTTQAHIDAQSLLDTETQGHVGFASSCPGSPGILVPPGGQAWLRMQD